MSKLAAGCHLLKEILTQRHEATKSQRKPEDQKAGKPDLLATEFHRITQKIQAGCLSLEIVRIHSPLYIARWGSKNLTK